MIGIGYCIDWLVWHHPWFWQCTHTRKSSSWSLSTSQHLLWLTHSCLWHTCLCWIQDSMNRSFEALLIFSQNLEISQKFHQVATVGIHSTLSSFLSIFLTSFQTINPYFSEPMQINLMIFMNCFLLEIILMVSLFSMFKFPLQQLMTFVLQAFKWLIYPNFIIDQFLKSGHLPSFLHLFYDHDF